MIASRRPRVRANMRHAVEESGLTVEALAAATGIPVKRLRTLVLNGDDCGRGLFIDDIYRVALALEVTDFPEWFREPLDVARRLSPSLDAMPRGAIPGAPSCSEVCPQSARVRST